jgi:hypothetical protein
MTAHGGNNLARLELGTSPLLPQTKDVASEPPGVPIQLRHSFGTKPDHSNEDNSDYTHIDQYARMTFKNFSGMKRQLILNYFVSIPRSHSLLLWTLSQVARHHAAPKGMSFSS